MEVTILCEYFYFFWGVFCVYVDVNMTQQSSVLFLLIISDISSII